MRKFLILFALVALFVAPAGLAFAAGGGEGNNTGCNGVGNPNSPCSGAAGGGGGDTGGGGGAAAATASATSSSSSSSSASATGVGVGSASSTSGGGSSDVRIDVPRQAPAAVAPGLTSAGTGVCLGSVVIAGSSPFGGLSFGITKVDPGCEQRSGAALLYQMGHPAAALRVLTGESIKDALAAENELPVSKVKVSAQEAPSLAVSAQPSAQPVPAAGPCGRGTYVTARGYCAWAAQ
jgi:hypothetical protein